MRASGLAVLGVSVLILSCGEGREPEPAAPPDLDTCPLGDAAWRTALDAAGGPEELALLRERVVAIAARHADRWEPSWAAGECLFRSGRPPESKADYSEALRRARGASDPTGIACAGNRLGAIALFAGELASGEASFAEALEAAGRAGRRDLDAFVRNNLAGLLVEKGEYARARDELEIAAATLESLDLPDAARSAAYNRAVLLLELGDAFGAERALEEVRKNAEAAKDTWTLDASAVVLGNLHLAVAEADEAVSWYAKVSEESVDLRAQAEIGLGRVALARGRAEEAARVLRLAVERAKEQERIFAWIAETFLARAEFATGDEPGARARLGRVLSESDASHAEESAWTSRWILGEIDLSRGRVDDAIPRLREAVSILEGQRGHLDPVAEGMRFLRERSEPYVALASALAARGGGAPSQPTLDEVLAVSTSAKAGVLRQSGPHEARKPARAGEIQRALKPGEIVVDYLIGEDRGVAVALTHREARIVALPGSRSLRAALRGLRRSFAEASTSEDAGGVDERRVREALLDPIGGLLAKATRLYVVPDGELALLPFAALLDPREPAKRLGERVETAFLPFAGPPSRAPGERFPVLLAGAAEGGPGDETPELPWAAYELSKIREAWGASRTSLLMGKDYTRGAIEAADPKRFRTLHLASHAVASTVDPRRCGVVLSRGELLGVDAVRRMRVDGALVVLSGCRTGEGEVIPGEGIVGLGWSFLVAGADAVVASRSGVDDAVSARLMIAFHRRLAQGDDPVAALHTASREIARKHPHPAYWATFSVVVRSGAAGS